MNFAPEDAPKSLGGYKLARVLGQGAQGAVHEALDPRWPSTLRREVAREYDLVVRRALCGNQADSFGSAAEFKNVLHAAFAMGSPPAKDESVLHPSKRT